MITPGSLDTIVVIPTYAEAATIGGLIREILALNNAIGCVVVDDNSPDDTSRIVATLSGQFPGRISLVLRETERGRATAGIRGHREAIKLKPKYIVEMDADFSHEPRYIPVFLREIQNCDVIVGSRFVSGGTDSARGLFRQVVSTLSGRVYQLILGLDIKDVGSGFKLYRREVLEAMPWDSFLSKGIAISMEEIFRIAKSGYRIREVPIKFQQRRGGHSKLRFSDFFEPLRVSIRLAATLGRA